MRSKFKEFYSDSEIDLNNLVRDTIVVFDTNSLLNIYRYSSETSNKFLDALTKIEDNIWVPYQVGLEFNLNRKKVMNEINNAPNKLDNEIASALEKVKNQINNIINEYVVKSVDAKEIKETIKGDFQNKIEDLKDELISDKCEEIKELIQNDEEHFNRLINILDGKIGESFNEQEIQSIIDEGKKRYELLIPPGYEDQKTKIDQKTKKDLITSYNGLSFPSKYGDLIVWKQLIKYVKDDNNICKVVFITDDNKPDWWYFIGHQKVGPRAELKNELIREANAELIMINSNSFIQQIEMTDQDIVFELDPDVIENHLADEYETHNYNVKENSNLTLKYQNITARLISLKEAVESEISRGLFYSNSEIEKLKKISVAINKTLNEMELDELIFEIDMNLVEKYYNKLIEFEGLANENSLFFKII